MSWFLRPFLPLFLLIVSSCGYALRGQERPFFKSNDIQRLYIHPVTNNSYKAGVEITLYNAIRKRFSQGGYVRIIDRIEDSDASIQAVVNDAQYSPSAVTTTDKIATTDPNLAPKNVQIASSYQVSLGVSFTLANSKRETLWSDSLNRTKIFAASNYLGTLGSTSALINEGEFERTLNDLAYSIATDAEESINSLF